MTIDLQGIIGTGTCVLSREPITEATFHEFSMNGYPHKVATTHESDETHDAHKIHHTHATPHTCHTTYTQLE